MNSLYFDKDEPTKLRCSFIILDFDVSGNNVVVSEEVALEASKTLLNMPIVTKFDGNDFGTHEYTEVVENGKKKIYRDTIPIGVFTSEGYVQEVNVNGEMKKVLIADGLLWHSRFGDACNLLLQWNEEGKKINMSCEYRFKNYIVKDNITYHLSPLLFEGTCILGSTISPAYESATFVDTSEFNLLVAQAINQERDKEDDVLADEIKDQELELNEDSTEKVEDEQVETSEEDKVEEDEAQVQLNELSHDDIRSQIREQVKAYIAGETWVWVADVYETYTVVEVEFTEENDYSYKHYKFNYTIEGETVTVDTSTQEEVKAKREWVAVTNELQEELNKVKSEKDDLVNKFAEATETIISLNSTIEELKPYQELALNAQREQKLAEQIEKYEVKFNAIGAAQAFKSNEVQELIMNSIEDSDKGKDALLKLSEILFNSIKIDKVEPQLQTNALAGIATKRDNKVELFTDDFDSKYKY